MVPLRYGSKCLLIAATVTELELEGFTGRIDVVIIIK